MLLFIKMAQNIHYIIHIFRMSEEEDFSSAAHIHRSSDVDSDNSDQFQQLKTDEIRFQPSVQHIEKPQSKYIQNKDKLVQSNHQKLDDTNTQTVKKAAQYQQQLESQVAFLKKQNKQLAQLYKTSLAQINMLKINLNQTQNQNKSLKDQNLQLRQTLQNSKQQSHQYIDKINCLQQKSQLQKQQMENKFTLIKKSLQKITKNAYKNADNKSILKSFTNTCESIQKLIEKIDEVQDMIIDSKKQKNKSKTFYEANQNITQKIGMLEKIKTVMIKQQTKINSLKDQLKKLTQQINEGKQNSGGLGLGIGKWLDPVMKFCKIQQGKPMEIKDRKPKNNT